MTQFQVSSFTALHAESLECGALYLHALVGEIIPFYYENVSRHEHELSRLHFSWIFHSVLATKAISNCCHVSFEINSCFLFRNNSRFMKLQKHSFLKLLRPQILILYNAFSHPQLLGSFVEKLFLSCCF